MPTVWPAPIAVHFPKITDPNLSLSIPSLPAKSFQQKEWWSSTKHKTHRSFFWIVWNLKNIILGQEICRIHQTSDQKEHLTLLTFVLVYMGWRQRSIKKKLFLISNRKSRLTNNFWRINEQFVQLHARHFAYNIYLSDQIEDCHAALTCLTCSSLRKCSGCGVKNYQETLDFLPTLSLWPLNVFSKSKLIFCTYISVRKY